MKPFDIKVPDNTGRRVLGKFVSETSAAYDNMGRRTQTRFIVACTGCGAEVEVYRWSYNGGGKICDQCHGLICRYGEDGGAA